MGPAKGARGGRPAPPDFLSRLPGAGIRELESPEGTNEVRSACQWYREASMKFGIFYELSVPRPWEHETERQVYMNALEQVRLADELGFHSVWAVEHHFLEEYSHCPAPELFLTACAMQT